MPSTVMPVPSLFGDEPTGFAELTKPPPEVYSATSNAEVDGVVVFNVPTAKISLVVVLTVMPLPEANVPDGEGNALPQTGVPASVS